MQAAGSIMVFVAALGSGLVGGIFYGFSSFVMNALARLPAAQGIAAMQSINVAVLNGSFLGLFLGTALVATAAAGLSIATRGAASSGWAIAGAVLYVVGVVGVTMAFNVPRNEALGALDPAAANAATDWARFVSEWTFWNHVRTAAGAAAMACFWMGRA